MPDNKNLHWTEDDDLLSRFVLGGLSPQEMKNLEEHVVSCLQCRELVEKERILATGIRQFGREDVKARLKNRLAAKPVSYQRVLTWQRVVSAAAVVVIITGVGIFSHWFSWGDHSSLVSMKEQEKTAKSQDGEVDAHGSQNTAAPSVSSNIPEETRRENKALDKSQSLQLQVAQNPSAAKRSQPDLNESTKGMQNLSGAASSGAGAVSLKKDLENQPDHLITEDANAQSFWVEGRVLSEQQVGARNVKAMKKAAAPNRGAQESIQSDKTFDTQHEVRGVLDQQETKIHQLSIHFLPSARQTKQREDGDKIQMKVERSDHGTDMTMYLDTPLEELELKKARIEQVTPDSIVIEVESRTIGFKMPINLLELQEINQRAKRR
jgi:hypothetical protein